MAVKQHHVFEKDDFSVMYPLLSVCLESRRPMSDSYPSSFSLTRGTSSPATKEPLRKVSSDSKSSPSEPFRRPLRTSQQESNDPEKPAKTFTKQSSMENKRSFIRQSSKVGFQQSIDLDVTWTHAFNSKYPDRLTYKSLVAFYSSCFQETETKPNAQLFPESQMYIFQENQTLPRKLSKVNGILFLT